MKRMLLVALSLSMIGHAARAEPCELATPSDCLQRGLELMQAGDRASVGFFMRACESKLPDACAQVGFLYMGSAVLARDDAQALAFSKRGCDLGSGLGCNNAAVLTRDGRGTAPDDKAMKKLAERSCTLGHGDGCFLFAAILEEGRGGAKPDLKKANVMLEKACELEDARSCEIMAARHLDGSHGAKQDTKLAAARFGRACDLGSASACYELGAAVVDGRQGFPSGGRGKALELLGRACELGHADACRERDVVAKAIASGAAEASAGTTTLTLVSRAGKKVVVRFSGGSNLVVGGQGEVSKEVSQMGFTMNLVIGTVKVTAVTKGGAELEVISEQSEIVIDGKKVDHWTAGSALELKWKVP